LLLLHLHAVLQLYCRRCGEAGARALGWSAGLLGTLQPIDRGSLNRSINLFELGETMRRSRGLPLMAISRPLLSLTS